jgi:hypothetical protein
MYIVDDGNNLIEYPRTTQDKLPKSKFKWSYYTAFIDKAIGKTGCFLSQSGKHIQSLYVSDFKDKCKVGCYYKISNGDIARFMGFNYSYLWFCREKDVGITYWGTINVDSIDEDIVQVYPSVLRPDLKTKISIYVELTTMYMSQAAFDSFIMKASADDFIIHFKGSTLCPNSVRVPALLMIDDFASKEGIWPREERNIYLDSSMHGLVTIFISIIDPGPQGSRNKNITIDFSDLFNFLLLLDLFGYNNMHELVRVIAEVTPIFYVQKAVRRILAWTQQYEAGFWGLGEVMVRRLIAKDRRTLHRGPLSVQGGSATVVIEPLPHADFIDNLSELFGIMDKVMLKK